MSYLPEHREVRVTARESIRPLFVAPDLSPVPLLDRELEKGTKGWTDFDVKVPAEDRLSHRPAGLADRHLEEMTAGTARIRRPKPAAKRRVRI